MNLKPLFLPLLSGALCVPVFAQTPAPMAPATPAAAPTGGTPAAPSRPQPALKPFATLGGFSFSGYVRSRIENFDFFEAPNGAGDSNYTFNGTQIRLNGVKSTPKIDLQFDLQQVLLIGTPDSASFQPVNATTGLPAGPRVPLGQGGNYFAANGNQDGALSVKQAFVRFKNLTGPGRTARLGRFEFNDGTETVAKDPTLNWLKTQRLSQRLIGTFGFTHTGRSFDGGQISAPLSSANLTLVAARPTQGVFELSSNDNVDAVNFAYGAYTKAFKDADARLFGMVYQDGREAPKSVKTDNRPLATRQGDDARIQVYTLGANYIKTMDVSGGKVDLLGWGAFQTGKWGALDHSGNAFDLEVGYQPKMPKLKPWLRLGYYQASGDGNAADGDHKTFFTPLPTPRLYARFPFYNQMNSKDLFAQFIVRPNPKTNLRLELHSLKLANTKDLYYSGGGAFQDSGFGIAGRPSGGQSKLANLIDISYDYAFNPQTSLGLYFAHAAGGDVIKTTYPGKTANFAFVELTRRF